MKRGKKNVDLRDAFLLVLFVSIGILIIIGISNTGILNNITGRASSETTGVTANVRNTAPVILSNNLDGLSAVTLLVRSAREINIIFKVEDKNGYNDINPASPGTAVKISRGGITRTSSSCIKTPDISPKRADINCTISMWYYDENATDWVVNVSAGDFGGGTASDSARAIEVLLLKDISITTTPPSAPSLLNFPTLDPGASDISADNNPINITNNGNYQGRLIVDGHNLTNTIDVVPVYSFSVHNTKGQECQPEIEGGTATQLSDSISGDMITSSNLPRGPAGSNIGQLYFCANSIPDPLTSGIYESKDSLGILVPWIIKIP